MKKDRFTQVWDAAIFDRRLRPVDFRVLCALLSYDWVRRFMNGERARLRKVWPSQQTLASRLGLHRHTIQTALRRLEECGYIEIRRGEGDGEWHAEDGRWVGNAYVIREPEPGHVEKMDMVTATESNFSTTESNFSYDHVQCSGHETYERNIRMKHTNIGASRENFSSLSSCPPYGGHETDENDESDGPIDLRTLKPAKPPVQADEKDEAAAIESWFHESWKRFALSKY